MPAFLTLDSISLATPDGRPLFDGLTLALGRERTGVVGRNGCGKSTLLRLIAGEGIRRLVVAGDDVADVGALRRAGELLGADALRIGVRSKEAPAGLEEVADVMVPGPEGVLEFLGRFA